LAREAVRRGGTPASTLVVVEGYMDVIALGQAGFDAAVAPLGTALTEEQLGELWRLSPAPVLCFDGDPAGARAAARAAELALPMLAPERTLRLMSLPPGEDPDSVVRGQGSRAFQPMLDAARPLADCLYDLLGEGTGETTPEQRAAFRTKLEEAARRIPDKALASEYRRILLDRFFASRRRDRGGPHPTFGRVPGNVPLPVRIGPRPSADTETIAAERVRILTAIVLRHPALWRDIEHAYAGLELAHPFSVLRDAVNDWASHAEVLDSQALMDHLDGFGLTSEVERILAGTGVSLPACASSSAMLAEAEAGWWHFFGFLNVERLREEVRLAEQEAASGWTEETTRRLLALKAALNKVRTGEPDGTDLAAE
jgi:DNA primase